jgi:hypothetical protein
MGLSLNRRRHKYVINPKGETVGRLILINLQRTVSTFLIWTWQPCVPEFRVAKKASTYCEENILLADKQFDDRLVEDPL